MIVGQQSGFDVSHTELVSGKQLDTVSPQRSVREFTRDSIRELITRISRVRIRNTEIVRDPLIA